MILIQNNLKMILKLLNILEACFYNIGFQVTLHLKII